MLRVIVRCLLLLSLMFLLPLSLAESVISRGRAMTALAGYVSSSSFCPALLRPSESIVRVASEAALRNQAYNAAPGTTILVETGVYAMQDFVHIVSNRITLRGETGDREDVILDFGGMESGHFGILVDGDDTTIADLTIRNARDHGVSIQGNDRPVLYNLHIQDIGDQLVKVNPVGDGSEDGLLACSRLEYTTYAPDDYTNGISAHLAHRWIVRDNEWYRIRGPGISPVPTILFWSASTDTVVERNLLVDCVQGISFGNASHGSGDHFGGIVRNNIIYATQPHDVVIEMVHADDWLVANNTALLLKPLPGVTWGMEARFSDSQGTFAYNLTNMDIWPDRDGALGTLEGNLTNAQSSWFVDSESGDLHLLEAATDAIDQAASLAEVTDDFDGDARPHGPAPDVGADEYGIPLRPWRSFLPLVTLTGQAGASRSLAPQLLQAPTLKWEHGGCYSSWCETGWYASPAVADLDGDGTMEVIASAYSIAVLDGETGDLEWRVASGHDRSEPDASSVGRTWPGIVVADVDGNGDLEIVAAHSGGYVSVYDHQGYFEPGWPQTPTVRELRGLAVYDLDADGSLEVIVTGAVYDRVNTWVYEHDGLLRPGWPQLSNDSGYAYGIFNDNAAVGDLEGDGVGEVVVPSDVHYICAYEADGAQIPAHSMYEGKDWGKVGVWESLAIELRGWGACDGNREESYRTNFAHGPAAIADLDGDGRVEVVATGNVYDCSDGHPPGKYNGVYVFNADRSRFNASGYDWQSPPVDTGAPLSEDWSVIENNQPNPVVADLDGDSEMEILYSSYDGRVHAFWLDKTEHGNWPYSIYDSGEGWYRFASEPVVADLDADGLAEVLFASWVQKGSNRTGKLHILNYLGYPLHEIDLPAAYGSPDWNGALAAPTLANLDADASLEVVLNTAHSGFVAYDLPGTEDAEVLWGTGRGNYQRTGSILHGTLRHSTKRMQPTLPSPGDVLTYTIRLENPGPALPGVQVTDILPVEVSYAGELWATAGSYGETDGVITWTGIVLPAEPVTITYHATVSALITEPRAIQNTALMFDGRDTLWTRQATAVVNAYLSYLPVVTRH